MIQQEKVNRRAWLAVWLQRRRRQRKMLAVWQWKYPNPAFWYAYHRVIGLNNDEYFFDDFVAGTARQYAPDGGQHLMFIVGVDEDGNEITHRSNAVRPDDALPNPSPVVSAYNSGPGELYIDCVWAAGDPANFSSCLVSILNDASVEVFSATSENVLIDILAEGISAGEFTVNVTAYFTSGQQTYGSTSVIVEEY